MTAVLRALAKKEDASLLLLDLSTISDLVAHAAEAKAKATVTMTAAAATVDEVEVDMTHAQVAGAKEDTNVDSAAAAAYTSPPVPSAEVEMEEAADGVDESGSAVASDVNAALPPPWCQPAGAAADASKSAAPMAAEAATAMDTTLECMRAAQGIRVQEVEQLQQLILSAVPGYRAPGVAATTTTSTATGGWARKINPPGKSPRIQIQTAPPLPRPAAAPLDLGKTGGAAGAASVGFKQGDRVRFVGQPRNSSSVMLLSLPSVRGMPAIMSTEAAAGKPEVGVSGPCPYACVLCPLLPLKCGPDSSKEPNPLLTRRFLGSTNVLPNIFPQVGAMGRVVVTFDESHPKVGVRFDKPVPMGTTLGGACENGHGLICSVAHLEPHAVSGAATVAVVDALEAAIRTLQRRCSATASHDETDRSGETASLKPVVVGLSSLAKGKEFAERNRMLAAMAARLPTPVLIVGCYPSAMPKDVKTLGSLLFPKPGGGGATFLR